MLTGAYTELSDLIRLRLYADRFNLNNLARVSSRQAGTRQSRLRGRGIEFSEVRAYQPGDDVRAIDWRVTARKGTPHTKQFNEEKDRPLLILLDQTPSMFFGSHKRFKSVLGAEAAALLGWAALQQNYRIGGVSFGNAPSVFIKPQPNRNKLLRFLHDVQAFNSLLNSPHAHSSCTGLETGLEHIRQHVYSGSMVVIISDFNAVTTNYDSIKKKFWQLSRHNEVICLFISDPLESELPQRGQYRVDNGQHQLVINANSSHQRKQHANAFASKEAALIRLCRQQHIQYIPLTTADDVLATFIATASVTRPS